MSVRSKVFHFLNRIVTIKIDNSKIGDVIKYDVDNLFPQNLISQLSESGTATSCIEALDQYAYAEGLSDESIGLLLANRNQTFNSLCQELTYAASRFQGVSLHVSRDTGGNIISIKSIPFENCRKLPNGDIVYNPTYGIGCKFEKEKDEIYCAFKGAKIDNSQLLEIVSYGIGRGEILYYFRKKPGQYTYPIPTYYSAISDINTDAENSKYELESVNNSFLPSGIINFVGDVDDKEKDETGRTEWDYLDETLNAFTGSSKDSKGESGRQKLAVFFSKTKDELAKYTPINNEGILTAIDISTRRVAEKVARAFGVPPFIIGLGGNVSFATNIIADNILLFNNRIQVIQELITTPLKMCFPEYNFELTQLNPIRYIDPIILADLTPSERRAIVGYKTEEDKSNSTVSLAQVLGVGGTQSLVAILQDAILTDEQKISTLEILFNLPNESAVRLVGKRITNV